MTAPTVPISGAAELRPARRRRAPGKPGIQSFVITLVAVCFIAAFVSPLVRSVAISLKSREQITQLGAPLYPADPVTFTYEVRVGFRETAGKEYGRLHMVAVAARQ